MESDAEDDMKKKKKKKEKLFFCFMERMPCVM
jgi:hypothetical protein